MGRVYVYYIVIHIYIYVNLHIFQYVIEFKMIYLVSKYLLIFLCIYDKCRYVYRYIHIIQDMHVFIVSSYIAYNNYIMCSLDIIYMINIFHIFYRQYTYTILSIMYFIIKYHKHTVHDVYVYIYIYMMCIQLCIVWGVDRASSTQTNLHKMGPYHKSTSAGVITPSQTQ